MLDEIADVVIDKVKRYAVGFGKAGQTPSAMGSGVLIKQGEVHGILTCTHVDQFVRKFKQPVGLVRFNREGTEQFGVLHMGDVFSYAAGEEPWTPGGEDIALIRLRPDLVGNIERDGVFLDAEKNFTKAQPESAPDGRPLILVHAVFGLVDKFTGATTRQGGRATTVIRGVLSPGTLRDDDGVNPTLECFEENRRDLPESFGGTSGGGLWRVYVRQRQDGKFEAIHHRLIGIASREIRGRPHLINCQGWKRIDATLEEVRRPPDPRERPSLWTPSTP